MTAIKLLQQVFLIKQFQTTKNCLKCKKKERITEEQKELIQREFKENECFFRSEWANDLAEFIGFSYNPETLIKKLRRETK